MAITAYNAKYNDDVNTPDINGLTPLDKNYLRVLFTPGRSVQSRELNQIQSLLQSQFDSVGRSLFKSNRPVVGGKPSFQRRLHIIEADINKGENELLNYWINNTDLVELQLSQPGTNLRAVPIKIELISSNDVDVDSWRFYVNYNSGNINESGENELVFRNSQIQLKNVVNNSSLDLNPTSLTKIGVAAQVEPGVFFTQGTFVKTEGQLTTAILRDEEIYYTGYVGFKVEENTITSDDDETLLDNAAGSLNFAGIGADRYQIKLTLVLFTPDELEEYNETIGNFVRLLTIEDSEQIQEITPLDLTSRLEEKLALRTNEESGDYTLKPFPINVHEVWNDDENNGRYTNLLDLQDAGFEDPEIAKNYYGVTLDPSIAYCKGYRVNLPEKDSIFATKSRTLYTELNDGRYLEHSINADMGNYIDVYTSGGLPEIDAFGTIYTLYGDIEKNYDTNSPPGGFSGDKIGTCKIQSVEGLGSSEQGPILRLYLHKVELLPGLSFKCVLKIQTDTIIDEDNNPNVSTYGQFVGMLLEPGQIFDINVNSSLFDTRLNAIKEYADLRVTEKRSAGNLVYTENNRIRVQFTLTEADEAFDKSPTNLHAVYNAPDLSAGRRYQVFEDFDVIQSESGSILTLDITDSIQNPDGQLRSGGVTNFVPSHSVRILFSVASRLDNNNLGIKKRVSDSYEFGETAENSNGDEVEVVVGGIYQLPNVYHLISVENTEYWQMIEDGQRNTEYVNARVKCLKQDSGNPENTIEFTHWEFSGTGNYYTVQSYRDLDDLYVPLEELPFYGGVPLGDIIDLRLRKDSYNRVALDPYSPIQMEVDVYLPRKDVVCVNTSGKFYILEGEPDFDPVFAKIPSDSMALWQITLPPYIFFIDEVKTKLVDNRRYTMANIRTLENRLANLEYYSLLSLLERGANDESIFDQNGERFKNGWVVDGFRNNAVGNLSHPEALYAINSNLGRAAPFHERDSLPLKIVNSVDTLPSGEFENGGLTEDTIGLRYTTVPYISQPLATQYISVQPWEIASAPGILDLWA